MPAKLEQVVIAADIGKKRDFTAICGIERWQNKWAWPYEEKDDGDPYYRLKSIERLPLDTEYNIQIEVIKWIYDTVVEDYAEQNIRPDVVIDATGCGTVVLDMVKKAIPKAQGIWFHGGKNVSRDGSVYNVPQSDLAMVLQILMQSKRVTFASDITGLDKLKKELLNFTYKVNINTGHTHFEAWRERDHDDQVYAVACGLWWLDKRSKKINWDMTKKFGEAIRGRPVRTDWIGNRELPPKEKIEWKRD